LLVRADTDDRDVVDARVGDVLAQRTKPIVSRVRSPEVRTCCSLPKTSCSRELVQSEAIVCAYRRECKLTLLRQGHLSARTVTDLFCVIDAHTSLVGVEPSLRQPR
jgi:hypothetical protein